MQKTTPKTYRRYSLSRVLVITDIVSADYISSAYPCTLRHSHRDAWEMACCLRGSVRIYVENEVRTLRQNELTLIPPGRIHDSSSDEADTQVLIISFICADNRNIALLHEPIYPMTAHHRSLLSNVITEIESAFQLNEGKLRIYQFQPNPDSLFGSEQMLCCSLEQLLISLLRQSMAKTGAPVRGQQFQQAMRNYLVESILSYIRQHISEPISLDALCEFSHYSRSGLSEIFSACTGSSVGRAISEERIAAAKELLTSSELTVAQISEKTGFASPQYFSRRFHAAVGLSPSEYLRKYRKNV